MIIMQNAFSSRFNLTACMHACIELLARRCVQPSRDAHASESTAGRSTRAQRQARN
jgi:hypothetical protein